MDSFEELLIQAIKESDYEFSQYCLSKGANPNKICSSGRTALGIAAQHGNLVILKTLADSLKNTVKSKSKGATGTLGQRAKLNLDFSKSKSQNKNVGYFVVRKDVDENEFSSSEGPTPEGMEGLEWDMEVTDNYLGEEANSSTPPEARIYKWYAEILNRTAVVLESPENDIGRFDRYGLNALHYAVIEGHCGIVEYLLDNFKEINVNQNDADMYSPLQIAVHNGDAHMVRLLLDKGAMVQFANRQRHTPLHLASQKGHVDIMNMLMERGATVNAYDLEDCSPLSLAILYGHEDAAEILIRRGTRLNHEESGGYTVIHRAVWNNMTGIAKILLEAGAKVIQSHHLLHTAIRNNNREMVKMLHRAGALLNVKDDQGQTPLMLSCIYKNVHIAKYLLKNGAPANAKNELTGLTALHICVDSIRDGATFHTFLELLLSYDADINAGSFMGNVLFYAIIVSNLKAACVLIRYGADVNLREERSFVDNLTLAKKNGNAELVRLIVYAGFDFGNMLFDMKCLKGQSDDDPLYDFMASVSATPLNLKDLCRIYVRRSLGRNLVRKIHRLPLPDVLLHYLTLEEL